MGCEPDSESEVRKLSMITVKTRIFQSARFEEPEELFGFEIDETRNVSFHQEAALQAESGRAATKSASSGLFVCFAG